VSYNYCKSLALPPALFPRQNLFELTPYTWAAKQHLDNNLSCKKSSMTLFLDKSDLVSRQPTLQARIFNILFGQVSYNCVYIRRPCNSTFLPVPNSLQSLRNPLSLSLTHTPQFQGWAGRNNQATHMYGDQSAFFSWPSQPLSAS
jgi:hypothetical protein